MGYFVSFERTNKKRIACKDLYLIDSIEVRGLDKPFTSCKLEEVEVYSTARYRSQKVRSRRHYDDGSPLAINLIWDTLTGAYKLNFVDPRNDRHWQTLKMLVELIKNKIPYGERDYDPDTKLWYISESNYQWLVDFMSQLPGVTLNSAKKPENQTSTTTFVPVEVILDTLKKLSGFDFKGLPKDTAVKTYRQAAFRLHPDRHADDPNAGAIMSQFNASWQKLQEQGYFK